MENEEGRKKGKCNYGRYREIKNKKNILKRTVVKKKGKRRLETELGRLRGIIHIYIHINIYK